MSMKPSELFQKLVDEQVEVVVIGGFAAITFGISYATQVVELCYNPDIANIIRLSCALAPLHPRLRVQGLTDEEALVFPFQLDKRTLQQSKLLTLQTDIVALDLMSSVPGIGDYEKVQNAAIRVSIYGFEFSVLDLPALIISKRAAGRPKDLFIQPQIEAALRLREQDKS